MAQKTLPVNEKDLEKIIKQRKEKEDKEFEKFEKNYISYKYDKMGNEEKTVNDYAVAIFFFKTINPISSVEPIYNGSTLRLLWDYYLELVERINLEITSFAPTLTHFAKFAGISLETLSNYKNSADNELVVVYNKIYDETFNASTLLSQNKTYSTTSTLYRMKVENGAIEKKAPNVSINLKAKAIDLNKINTRLTEIQTLTSKQVSYEEK